MSTHTAFAITDTRTHESFTYVRGDHSLLTALYPEPSESVAYALETVSNDLDHGHTPDRAVQTFLCLHITTEASATEHGGVL